jgi:hypothetical protein
MSFAFRSSFLVSRVSRNVNLLAQAPNVAGTVSQNGLCYNRTAIHNNLLSKRQRSHCFSTGRNARNGVEKSMSEKQVLDSAENETHQGFLTRFLGPKPMPERGTAAWYREMVLICTVFAITGSSTMMLVRGLTDVYHASTWTAL